MRWQDFAIESGSPGRQSSKEIACQYATLPGSGTMLIIRKQMMEAFEQQTMANFENRAVAYLHENHRNILTGIPEKDIRQSIREGIRRASAYGIATELDVLQFIDLMYLMSSDFDTNPRTSWVRQIFKNSRIPTSEKIGMIHERAITYKHHLI
jgi:hypothetical protein